MSIPNLAEAAQTALDFMSRKDPNVYLASAWDWGGEYVMFIFKRNPSDTYGFYQVSVELDKPDRVLRYDGGLAATLQVPEVYATLLFSLD